MAESNTVEDAEIRAPVKGDVERDGCELVLDAYLTGDSEGEGYGSVAAVADRVVQAEACAGTNIEVEGVGEREHEIVDSGCGKGV